MEFCMFSPGFTSKSISTGNRQTGAYELSLTGKRVVQCHALELQNAFPASLRVFEEKALDHLTRMKHFSSEETI